MSLKTPPPKDIIAALIRLEIRFEDVELAVQTDINSLGVRDPQWLLATRDCLFVFDPQLGTDPLYLATLEEISEFRNSPAIGSGILQVRVDGVWLDLMRFSNRNKHHFERVLKRLCQLKRDEMLLPFEQDAVDPKRCPTCGLMLEFAGELCPRCIDHGAALGRVMQLMQPYWKSALVLTFFLLAGVGLDMAWPLLTRYLVDHVLARAPAGGMEPGSALSGFSPYQLLSMVVAALASVHLLRGIVNVITGKIGSRVGSAMTFDVRGRLVRRLEELGLAYYSKHETGSLVGRIAYDTDAIQGFVSQITSGFVMQFLLVLISFGMMFSLQPTLALWAMLPAPLVIGGAYVYWRHVHPQFQRYWDRSSKQAGALNGLLSGIRVVKAFAQEDNEFQRFQAASLDVRGSREVLDRTAAYFYPVMALVFQVGGWVVWYVGGSQVLEDRISLGTLMAFFGYLSMFYGPLGNLTNLTTWLTQFSTQMHRIFEVLDTPTVLPEARNPLPVGKREGRIEFRDVTFGYSRGVPVVRNLSFEIAPGEKIGIVGRSGSGKTSIINLLARFYDVDSGSVLVDGVDLRDMSKQELRSRISMVLQEPFLFRGSLRDNIAYGFPGASPEAIISASRSASAHDFVMSHALAYDSSVGERGQELSGGERQRISIARALLCETPILVLDEATSALDSESELAIQTALAEGTAKNRTTLIIAHRLSTLQNCDRILVIEHGSLVECGTHRKLLELDGRYARWVRIQQGKSYIETDGAGRPVNDRKRNPFPGYPPRWLKPGSDTLERGARGELQLRTRDEVTYRGVYALRCFPVHQPTQHISLRCVDAENEVREIGIVRDLAEWPPTTRCLIEESLNRRYFFHTIQKIHSVRKLSQFLTFTAQTDLGKVEFMMRQEPESAQDYGSKGKLLIDVEDNLYVIPDLKNLAQSDREVFYRYIYW